MLQYFEKQLAETKELTREDIDNLSPTGKAMFSVGDKMLRYTEIRIEDSDEPTDESGLPPLPQITFSMKYCPHTKIDMYLPESEYEFDELSTLGIPQFKSKQTNKGK